MRHRISSGIINWVIETVARGASPCWASQSILIRALDPIGLIVMEQGQSMSLIPLDKFLRPRRGHQPPNAEATKSCNPSHHATVCIDRYLAPTTSENWWTPSQLEPKGATRSQRSHVTCQNDSMKEAPTCKRRLTCNFDRPAI